MNQIESEKENIQLAHSGKKKLCLVMGSHWSAIMGGAQYQAKCITESILETNNYEIFYLARRVASPSNHAGYHICQIPRGKRKAGSTFLLDTLDLIRLIRSIQPDIVYQRGLQPYTGIAAYAAKSVNAKFIFHIAHDYDVSPMHVAGWTPKIMIEMAERFVGQYGLRNADCVIAQTQHQAALLKKYYGREIQAVIPNFHPFPKEIILKAETPIRVVWVANFKKTKRPEIFVKLSESMQDRDDVEFVMIGRPGEKKLYSALHERISKIRNLKYLGELSIEEVNEILASAHIFVNTSVAEGFPNTFIQAWMRKVPVISLNVTVDDVLDDEKIGVLSGSYERLHDSVLQLIENHELRKTMGDDAQKYAFQHYSVKNIEKVVSVIRDCK